MKKTDKFFRLLNTIINKSTTGWGFTHDSKEYKELKEAFVEAVNYEIKKSKQ